MSMEWQLIDSAPEDGTEILGAKLYESGWVRDIARYTELQTIPTVKRGWTDGNIDEYGDYVEWKPTHWHPLPEPPSSP